MIVFREDCYYLRDLHKHRTSIEQADLVLISVGINDLRHNKVDPWTLHDHLRHFSRQFCNTQIIFDAISPLAMIADQFNHTNNRIERLNELLLNLSLRSKNFKLFDNLSFGLPHLARDGLHFNDSGKAVLSQCWVNCILISLGFRRGGLPLCHKFVRIATDFSLKVR